MATTSRPTKIASTKEPMRSQRRNRNAMSERLADADVGAPVSSLGLALHEEPGDGVQLVADVEPHRADGGVVAKTWAHGEAEAARIQVPGVAADAARVDEGDGAQLGAERHAHLARRLDDAEAADRLARVGQGAQLVAAPAANAGRAAEEVALEERHRDVDGLGRVDGRAAQAAGEDDAAAARARR